MPQLLKVGGYLIYFWSNEGQALEPVHVHVSLGTPSADSTKIWIAQSGGCLLANNNSRIPPRILRNLMRLIEAEHCTILQVWKDHFGKLSYYC